MKARSDRDQGFSLLEVLVAVCIISVSGLALVSAHRALVSATASASQSAIAEARAEMLRLVSDPERTPEFPVGERDAAEGFGIGLTWEHHSIRIGDDQALLLILPSARSGSSGVAP